MDKVILITGTRKGIGKELSEYYLNKGFIVAGCSRGASSIDHQNYRHFELDVSDEKAVIKIGLNLDFAALIAASKRVSPFLNSSLANSTINIAFLAAIPISITNDT